MCLLTAYVSPSDLRRPGRVGPSALPIFMHARFWMRGKVLKVKSCVQALVGRPWPVSILPMRHGLSEGASERWRLHACTGST